jgi:hypothetical protein
MFSALLLVAFLMSAVIVQPVNAGCDTFAGHAYLYEALLDTDNNATTGGSVDGRQGFEYRVIAFLDSSGQIAAIELWVWDVKNECWENVKIIDVDPYDVTNSNAGVNGSDVVEFYVEKADIGDPESMRIVYHATKFQKEESDFTDQFYYPAMQIPTMKQWGLMTLILLFGCGSLFILRRQKRLSGFLIVLISLLTVAGIAVALVTVPPGIDGEVDDWNGIDPAVIDDQDDSSIKDAGEEIYAGFIRSEIADFISVTVADLRPTIFFRMDIEAIPD